ncbi:MAG: glycosyl transferase [Shinella sp.]|nr:MAG: glycosyl transferase [Shinella sp.]
MRHGKAADPPEPASRHATEQRSPLTRLHGAVASHLIREAEALSAAGFGAGLIARMADRAALSGATVEDEILASGFAENDYFAALARYLGVAFLPQPASNHLSDTSGLDIQLLRPEMLRLHPPGRPPIIAVVPTAPRLFELAALLDGLPDARTALTVTSRKALRTAVWKAGERRRVREAVTRLFDHTPQFSARVTLWGLQGFYGGVLLTALTFGALLAPLLTGQALHAFLSFFYFAALLVRAAALLGPNAEPVDIPPATPDETGLPVYTVMVALYRESAVVRQLVEALERIDWPSSRLDIKLVCEAGDTQTIAALKALPLGPAFEIVEVPAMLPVTKPKALTYALSGARGAFTVIYDAEDRPHPRQLREAHRRFSAGPATLACLQAPLHIANGRESAVSALFSMEYAALFRSLLPMLARSNLPLPLGGTSNHFRTEVLRSIGGWDPFNVTEDADLGLRLHRLGYRSGMLSLPTIEDAPTGFRIWLNQRTRWYKGWMQTWLVVMRSPFRLVREIGVKASLAFHLLIGGMILSSLAHPLAILLVAHALHDLLGDRPLTTNENTLLAIDLFNVLGSYWIFRQMGMKRMTRQERRAIGWRQWALPVYWLALSLAAWRALPDLIARPFFWAKTPHIPAAQDMEEEETGAGSGNRTRAFSLGS